MKEEKQSNALSECKMRAKLEWGGISKG